jgi:hypothetical protein
MHALLVVLENSLVYYFIWTEDSRLLLLSSSSSCAAGTSVDIACWECRPRPPSLVIHSAVLLLAYSRSILDKITYASFKF